MSGKEQTFFFKRLAYLTTAGIPLVEALAMLREQARSKRAAHMLGRVVLDVQEGKSFSRALGAFPQVFSGFCISILKVGESSGSLPATLEYLAEELKKKQQLQAKVVSACIYPAVIMLATLGITVFLLLFLFPKITPIFKSLNAELPLSTRVVMATSTFLGHYGLLVLAIFAVASVGFVFAYKRSTRFVKVLDTVSLTMPLLGGMFRSYSISNLSRMLGLLLKSGVTLAEAMSITADATPNVLYRDECKALRTTIARGERFSVSLLRRSRYFPPTFCHMVAVGEKSGTLPETFLYLADMYDTEVDEYTKNLSTLIEPVLMIGMGVVVGFIAVSIITPIYGITQNLHS